MDAWIQGMEANRENSNAVAEHQEVPKEESVVETIGPLNDRHLAVGSRRRPKMVHPGRRWPSLADSTAQGLQCNPCSDAIYKTSWKYFDYKKRRIIKH